MRFHVKIYLIIFLSVFTLILLNEVNLSYIKPHFPYKQGLITTADEYSYFSPVDQFVKTLHWSQNADGAKAYMRTPGYGFIYLIAKLIGGSNVFLVLKIIQILLFSGSILLFSKILETVKLSTKLTLAGTLVYGLLPCFSGFTYYTLSESILPFFVLWSFYSILKADTERPFSFEVLFSSAMLMLIRPQMIVLPLVFLLYFLIKRQKITFSLLAALLPLLLWNVRTISITGEWSGFHPIYSKSNNSLYRDPHKEMTNLFRIWEVRGDVFHNAMGLLSRDTSAATTQEVLKTIPSSYSSNVQPILKEFQDFRFEQQTKFAGKAIKDYLPGEEKLIHQIDSIRKLLIAKNSLEYYVKTPAHSFKKLMVTSMMNLYVFQEPWRDNLFVLLLKYFSFFIIVLGFFSSCYFLLRYSTPYLSLTALTVVLSLFYLSYVQRFNEERYLLPYLSLMLIHLLFIVDLVLKTKTKKATH